jgi:hypothetical protein
MKTHVLIATTEGAVFIQRITAEDLGVQSVICLDGTAQVLPISAAYHAFVRRGSGVIARDFGHDAFRIDVGARIDQGHSWQLPVYLAHALQAQDCLGDGRPQPGDRVLWATGEVDMDLVVRPVAGVAQKLAHAIAPVRALRERGIEVQLLLPSGNVGESAGQAEELGGVAGVTRLADVLPIPIPATRTAEPVKSAAPTVTTTGRARRWHRLWVTVIGLVVLAALASYLQPHWFSSPSSEGLDLDDFGE